ncbi:hypothetical protein ILUMI_27024 [Ignelater luminosus]|uniref:Retinoblastoma-associated protein B-box domain-containing protein n=1 Tax=Ignelater luminosus TaxID=2038154 RepID=A0A8K0FY44_IGNLU|nr:hypothetical protein ILUMI_27024 [Ignelater luminosus]
MEHYRVQPQASSHIYRNVLITRNDSNSSENSQAANKNLTESEKRGDLISFYNTVYVQAMRSFALQFSSSSSQNANITLSPLPLLVNNNLASPRCQITNNLFIMPYDTPTTNGVNKGKTLEYHFSRSPSKDLEKINNAINKSIVSKRLLGDEDEGDIPNKRFVSKKMQSLVEARLSHNTE